jgi:Response regulator containing a CheY-like receiver domain and a GGDEF domain
MGGAAAATVALALSVPHGFGVDLYPVSALLLGIAFMTMSYAIVRYRSLEIDLFVNKTMQALLFVVPLLVLHIVISGLVLKILGFLPATTFSLFIVISVALLTPYKRCIQSLVDRTVYRGRYDYQKVLRELCQTLTAIVDFEQLLDYMLHIIMQTIDVERIAVFLEDEEQGTFVIKALSGLEEAAQDNVSLGAADPLVMRLRKERAILVRGELRQFEPIDNVERQFSSLAMLIPEVVVPLFFKDHLIGMVVLGGRRSEHIYNDGDIEVLRAFAVEAAKAVEHARLYGEAIVDSATMVYNQNYFLTRLREEIARSKRYGHPISLMFIEIETGDFTEQGQKMLLLKGIGLLLKTKVRNVDIVARYSGERFALILPETAHEKSDSRADLANKHKEDTLIVAERVRTSIEYFKKKIRAANRC